MIGLWILIGVTVMSAAGGNLAFYSRIPFERIMSLLAAIASIASVACFLLLVRAYNARPIELFARNPLGGLGPWDLLALLLSLAAITASTFGGKKARLPLLAASITMFSFTLFTLTIGTRALENTWT